MCGRIVGAEGRRRSKRLSQDKVNAVGVWAIYAEPFSSKNKRFQGLCSQTKTKYSLPRTSLKGNRRYHAQQAQATHSKGGVEATKQRRTHQLWSVAYLRFIRSSSFPTKTRALTQVSMYVETPHHRAHMAQRSVYRTWLLLQHRIMADMLHLLSRAPNEHSSAESFSQNVGNPNAPRKLSEIIRTHEPSTTHL